MAKPKTNLPKLTVEFRDGVAWGVYYHRPSVSASAYEYHQYAPVQKPRVCVWTYLSISRTWSTDCGHHDWKAERHCPYCGGRITRRSPR